MANEDLSSLDKFFESCQRGNIELVQEALDQNPDFLVATGSIGNTALHWAALAGHDDITDLLCQRGAYVNVANEVGDTPLHLASWKDHPAVVEVLLRYQADKNMQNHDGRTPYSMARSDEVKQLLPEFDHHEIADLIQIADEDD